MDGTAGLAHAGGPTSVLIVNHSAHRATGLYYTEARYDELARAIGGVGVRPSGSVGKDMTNCRTDSSRSSTSISFMSSTR